MNDGEDSLGGVEPNDEAEPPAGGRPDTHLSFPVVGIGASAGGLEALESLTQRLSSNGMAFVIVQHLPPGHVSMLPEILQRGTPLPVHAIEDGLRLEPGAIHVAPASVELTIEGEVLRVAPCEGSRRATIDGFFRSLAEQGGPRAIGVVLSGSGTDGTLGLKAIKAEGGLTFVQEPTTASQPGMPQSAVDAGYADFVLSPAAIGDELGRVGGHPYVASSSALHVEDDDAMRAIFDHLRESHGVDFGLYKTSTVHRRIERRMAVHRLESARDYAAFLGAHPQEVGELYNDLLIGVTRFFRDREPFEALKSIVLPRILDNRPLGAPIRLWVAGCATGEEAYSIAIVVLEFMSERAAPRKVQIFATDLDEDALTKARAGAYPANIELDVSRERIDRFFVRTDKGYQVSRAVRDLVVFARHNLGKDPPFSRVDLVTCRNVLIYLQPPLQKRILRIFHYALNPDGFVLLGTSESVSDAADLFTLVERRLRVYSKKNVGPAPSFEFALDGPPPPNVDDGTTARERRPSPTIEQMADRKVIEKYAPAGVIVDDRLEVLQFRGKTSPFLEHAPGAATLNLLKLVRPELAVALRVCAQRCFSQGLAVTSQAVPLWGDAGLRAVRLDVIPLADPSGRRSLLVLFDEDAVTRTAEGGSDEGDGENPRLVELERELARSKEYLQSTIEELEASNEELQSANEELQSSNEELQSTNEELETSKEELQSTNEELATVNDELHSRMTQLTVANDDLQNVLLNSSCALVLVGSDLRIRRFSASAEKLLSLVPGDAGRPIAFLRNVMSGRDLEQLATEALATISVQSQRVRCLDAAWYTMKIVPYVTTEHMIRGLVLEFLKTTAPAALEGSAIPVVAQQVLSSLPDPLILVDARLQLAWANRALFEAFAISPEVLGKPLAEAWGSRTDPVELWAYLDDLLSGRSPRDILIDRPFGRPDETPMRLTGRLVPSTPERPLLAMISMRTVDGQPFVSSPGAKTR